MKRLLMAALLTACTITPASTPTPTKPPAPKQGSQIEDYCEEAHNIVLIELKTALRYQFTCHGKQVTLDIPAGYPYAIEITKN